MKRFILSLLILSSLTSFGQATKASQDFGIWATVNLEKKLSEKFSIMFTEEFRLRDNATRINLFYSDLGVEFRPAKIIKFALSYRNIQKNLIDGTYSYRHRIQLDITLKKKFGNFAVSYRQRLQREQRDVYNSENGQLAEWYSRNKITVKYDMDKPLKPYVAVELRYQIQNYRLVESDNTWHRARYIAGLDYKLNDKSTVGLYYLMQNEFNVKTPQSIYIVGVEYSYSF
ncbi:MAG: hypothetical protein K0S44_2666 [Bacteroidetes bacterium]|jgi:hypothetical protein|nr:hypothetical protein [Bacteroidota bacterium]